MTDISEILPRLKGVKKTSNGYVAFCPAHEDRTNRSLTLTQKDGKLLMHCFVGCSFGSILEAAGFSKESIESIPLMEDVYDYTDAEGNLIYQVVRYYPKSFMQRRADGNGGYIWNLKGIEQVLYQLPKVIEAVSRNKTIFIVEGEKDCINLGSYGLTATTNSGGASAKWLPQYTEVLKNAQVAIIPDNDNVGRKHAEKIASFLYGWVGSLKVLNLGSKDVTEWLKTHNLDELDTLIETTKEYVPIGAVTRDEFNSLKGHIRYIQDRLYQRAGNKEYTFTDVKDSY